VHNVGGVAVGARLVSAETGGLLVTSVYVPNGKRLDHEDFPAKLAWLDTLATHLRETHRKHPAAIVGGDFNIVPAAIDSWNEERLRGGIFHTDEERSRFRTLLDDGLTDLFRHAHPDAAEFSWWDYRGGAFHRKLGLRIDFLLANPAALSRVEAVVIDRDYRKKKEGLTPSDHAPVFADLEL